MYIVMMNSLLYCAGGYCMACFASIKAFIGEIHHFFLAHLLTQSMSSFFWIPHRHRYHHQHQHHHHHHHPFESSGLEDMIFLHKVSCRGLSGPDYSYLLFCMIFFCFKWKTLKHSRDGLLSYLITQIGHSAHEHGCSANCAGQFVPAATDLLDRSGSCPMWIKTLLWQRLTPLDTSGSTTGLTHARFANYDRFSANMSRTQFALCRVCGLKIEGKAIF